MVEPWLSLPAPADLAGRPRVSSCRWHPGSGSSELHDGVELEAGLGRVVHEVRGPLTRHERAIDEVREIRTRAQGERVQQLIVDTDHRPLHVRPAEAEVAPRE